MRIIALLTLLSAGLAAQTPSEPPTLIKLIRNTVPTRAYADAKASVTMLAMSSIAGAPETWMLEAHDSFGSIEDLDRALNGVAAPASQTMILLYKPGLSYRPDQAVRDLPKARYFAASIYEIRPGGDLDFAELVKLRRAGYDSINLDRPEIVYQAVAGAPSGTYLFLAPLKSLRLFDNGLARTPAYAEALAESGSTAGRKIAAAVELSRELTLLRTEPKWSYVSEEFAAADPEFWKRF